MGNQQIYTCLVCGETDSGCTATECLITLNEKLQ